MGRLAVAHTKWEPTANDLRKIEAALATLAQQPRR